jgi:putative NIF3 family GTP cyclohydrolase 1 type 2
MAWFGSPRGPPNAASSFTHLISSSLERRFPKKFASAGHTSGLTIGTLREAERGGTAVVVICVDLTEQVLAEAISLHANVIIACSLFPSEPLRSLRVDEPVGRIVLRCAQQSIAAHCLSSACANAPGGVADWLAKSIASGATRPIVPHAECAEAGEGRLLECNEAISLSAIIARLKDILGVRHLRISLGAVVDELNIAKASDSCFIKSIAVHIGEGGELLHGHARNPATGAFEKSAANQALAERVHLSPSACLRRVKALEDAGERVGVKVHDEEQCPTLGPVSEETHDVRMGLGRESYGSLQLAVHVTGQLGDALYGEPTVGRGVHGAERAA